MSLTVYRRKRDFTKTQEPKGHRSRSAKMHNFVIQKHDASHLHYDFRLEMNGVLKSWAVPKGPSLNPNDKRLAVEVEDHPVGYADFEGEIPQGEYGGGHVIVWDRGVWSSEKNPSQQLKKGRLEFQLKGEKLSGAWILVRTGRKSSKKPNWLLIKRHDSSAKDNIDVTDLDKSVISDITIEELKAGAPLKKAKKINKKSVSKSGLKTLQKPLPTKIEPQLATLVDRAPNGENWLHEIKFDGYRTLTIIKNSSVRLLTRSGLDWTSRYKPIQQALKKLKLKSAVIDGEICVLDEKKRTSFEALQNALEDKKTARLEYFVFDLLYLNGHDLRDQSLGQRKELLRQILNKSNGKVHYSEHWTEAGESVFRGACKLSFEGIISKNKTKSYHGGRSRDWLKTKCKNTQEFIVVGYTLQSNSAALGSLLLGAYNAANKLQYSGRVGTGFNHKTQRDLIKQLKKIHFKKSATEVNIPKEKDIIWVKPQLVANIEFSNWTDEKVLRHASFQGLREDKKAREVKLDEGALVKEKPKVKSKSLELSNPDKVLFSKSKVTKLELAEYYISHQKQILPHISRRPLSLLRCPDGESSECFFQKHVTNETEAIRKIQIESKLKKKKDEIFYVDSIEGVVETVQLGSLELHVRGGHVDKIDYADIIVFDFDPDDSVPFKKVKEAAVILRKLLLQLKLKSFVKVTGGKGLHVHVPIADRYNWDQIKNFAHTICDKMVEDNPKLYTTEISKKKRKDKIFLDYLRNGYGATAIVPYSVRAKPDATIAWPIKWSDLGKIKSSSAFTVKSVKRLKIKADPWIGYFKLRQKIGLLE